MRVPRNPRHAAEEGAKRELANLRPDGQDEAALDFRDRRSLVERVRLAQLWGWQRKTLGSCSRSF